MSEDNERDEYDVAVVVFCRAHGVDLSDAQDAAAIAIRHSMGGGRVPAALFQPQYLIDLGIGEPVIVAEVQGLSLLGGQGIRLVVTSEPFRQRGFGPPKKAGAT